MAHISSTSPASSLSSSCHLLVDDSTMEFVASAAAQTAGLTGKLSKARLEQLKNHPLFGDLQLTLAQDCLQSTVPFTLLSEKSPQKSPKPAELAFCTVSDKIIEQHVKMQALLINIQAYYPSLLSVYLQITEQVESQRYRALTYNCYSDYVKQLINWFYDNERQLLIDRIQETVSNMASSKSPTPPTPPSIADLQKLSASLSKTASQRFGMFVQQPVLQTLPTLSAKSSPDVISAERPLDLSDAHQVKKPTAATPTNQNGGEKKSRFLSKKAVAILQAWYQKHRDHPYATDDEVRELALAGGITPNQVKKWMANTRARSYNTLTYNGGKHILNSKLAMKKKLLHKYKIDPPNNNNKPNKMLQQMENAAEVKNSVEAVEDKIEEVIDVETVSEVESQAQLSSAVLLPNGLPITPTSRVPVNPAKTEDAAIPSALSASSNKPSLEQVVARCRQISETDKVLSQQSAEKSESPTNKSAIENLRTVVNSVSPTHMDDLETDIAIPTETDTCTSPDLSSANCKRFLSPYAKTILNEWFRKHLYRPYPTYEEKRDLARLCGISSSKVDTWFANKRNRTHNTKKLPPKYSHLLGFSGLSTEEQ